MKLLVGRLVMAHHAAFQNPGRSKQERPCGDSRSDVLRLAAKTRIATVKRVQLRCMQARKDYCPPIDASTSSVGASRTLEHASWLLDFVFLDLQPPASHSRAEGRLSRPHLKRGQQANDTHTHSRNDCGIGKRNHAGAGGWMSRHSSVAETSSGRLSWLSPDSAGKMRD